MKAKNRILVGLMGLILFGLSLYALLKPAEDYSLSERRSLAQFPDLSLETLLDGSFTANFEGYTQDQFPFRESMRTLKALSNRYLLGIRDNNGLYSHNGYLSKLEYPLNQAAVTAKGDRFAQIYDSLLAQTDCRVYLSVIPDKNVFLAPLGGYPTADYSRMLEILREKTGFATYIDIFSIPQLEDYYFTDQHWRQECVTDVAQALAEGMGAVIDTDFTEHRLDHPFVGTYSGQSALNPPPDTIRYLTNPAIDGCTVTSYNTGKAVSIPVYDLDKAQGKDGYEMFLNGADALVVIDNPSAATDRELVIFRDSFSSSLAPLLISGYRKITLVDLRYMDSSILPAFVDFTDQDVLFCYSTLILNSTLTLR